MRIKSAMSVSSHVCSCSCARVQIVFESGKIVRRQISPSLSSDFSAASPVRRSSRIPKARSIRASYQFGNALLNQGFILFPVLGISPFFLGRLLELPQPDLPESRTFPPGWFRQAGFASFIGVVIIASFLIDIFNLPRAAGCVRLGAIVIYLGVRMPFRGRNFLANCLRAGLMSILLGLAVAALLPNYRIGALHVVFITGFSFMVFTVAIRVIFGHSGNAILFQKRLPFLVISGLLLVIAMLSRVTAEFSPRARDHSSRRRCGLLVAGLVDLDGEGNSESGGDGTGRLTSVNELASIFPPKMRDPGTARLAFDTRLETFAPEFLDER